MSDIIILPVLARHFRYTEYCELYGLCAIEKAGIDYFKTNYVREHVSSISVNDKKYKHIHYGYDKFLNDIALASAAGYDDTIIFNLELKEVL